MSPEVVFFFGPPFSGKTVYYIQKFSHTHERICPHELFEADPTLSLRAVILKVICFINKGQSVVVDDENSCKKSRRSYLTLLKNKVQRCQCRVVNFQVPGFQCMWSREWQLAQQMEFSLCTSFMHLSRTLEQWFGKRPEIPAEDEGFQRIDTVNMGLIGETPYKFEIPALFLHWEGLLEFASDEPNSGKVADVVRRWSNSNCSGRVIVIKANEKRPCAGKEVRCECVEEMKQLISWLVKQLSVPIYIVHIPSFVWLFSKPPQPGLLAWLQRLHCIDLYHRATFYVHSSETHLKAASTAGVKCIKIPKAKKLFDNPQMIGAVYLGVVSPAPECVRKARLAWFASSSTGDRKDPQQSRPSASLPLYHQALMSRESTEARPVYCVSDLNAGRVHGLCFEDFSSLERYNALYEGIATPTQLASNSIFGQTSSNIRTMQESKAVEVAPVKSPDGEVRQDGGDANCLSTWMKHLLPVDIEKHAFSPGHFKRGKGCSQLVHYVKTSMEQDALSLSANCLGSQGQLYDVSVLLSKQGGLNFRELQRKTAQSRSGIEKALCSCPDPASKLGKCKHVVGLLLWCKREEGGSLPEIVCKRAADGKQHQRALQDVKNKSLPSWMSSVARNTPQGSSDDNVTKNQCAPSGINSRRFKRKQSAKSTLYCMNAEELLETAMQVMEEYHYSQSDPFVKEQTFAPNEKGLEEQMKLDSINRSQHHVEDSKRRKQLSSIADSNVLGEEFSLSNCRDDISPSLCTVVSRRNVSKPAFVIPETAGMTIEQTQGRTFSDHADNSNRTPSSHTADSQVRASTVSDNEQASCQDIQGEEKRTQKLQTSVLEDFI